jgi:hypothetical protein
MKYLIKESQYVHLLENLDKKKRLFTKLLGEDVINSIREITSPNQLPIEFLKSIGTSVIQRYIDVYGPLYYFVLDGEPFLYKERISPRGEEYEMYITDKGKSYLDGEITDRLGLSDMGLNFSDVIDTIFNEGESLNEENDISGEPKENTKIKNLLKKVLENKEFEYSFKDKWEDLDGHIETYTIEYHIEVEKNILGSGSDTVAGVAVIIDDILVDGESVYLGWVEIGYSENVWYIDKLHNHLNDEVFEVFPFSIYPTFYGYDEEKTTLNESLIFEETNKSVKLLKKYYDIEGDGAYYRGENKIQTLVTLFPKDYDDEMTPDNGSSICNWEYDDQFNLIFKFMTLPSDAFIPLMAYIGNTEELEEYLEDIHRVEAKKFILRLKKR